MIPRMPLLPSESASAFHDLRQAILSELAPSTAYQTAIAENLVALEWEIHRHRAVRIGLLRKCYRDAAESLWESERSGIFAELGKKSPEAKEFAAGLLDPRSEHAASSQAWLSDHNIDPAEMIAAAYREAQDALEPHERKLAELEKRRRHLKEDYEKLKAVRVRTIEEAKLLDDHDD